MGNTKSLRRRAGTLSQVGTLVLGGAIGHAISIASADWGVTNAAYVVLTTSVAALFVLTLQVHGETQGISQHIETADHLKLSAEFVEDSRYGESYLRAEQLVRNAALEILTIEVWAPRKNYQIDSQRRPKSNREKFYKTLEQRISSDSRLGALTHRRLIQVEGDIENSPQRFSADLVYLRYLHAATKVQQERGGVSVRMSTVRFPIHFMLIDQRHVVLPILVVSDDNTTQRRHGAIFIDDPDKRLVPKLKEVFDLVANSSHPLDFESLPAPD